ncbi:hypothetical protein Tco_0201716 [Tanacetum coccineum]
MWPPTALSFRLLPATTINHHRSITVAAKHPRHRNNNNKNITYDFSDEEDEEQEQEQEQEPETYVSNDQQQQETYVSTNNNEDANKISGSAVLLALQKASAVKTSKKVKKKKVMMKKVNDENVGVDYSDVKELCIKSDWKERLDDLEIKLHHLIHHAT